MELNPNEILFNQRFNILYFIFAFISFLLMVEYVLKNKNTNRLQTFLLAILSIILIFLIGTRNRLVGIDTEGTLAYFEGSKIIKSLSELKDVGIYIVSISAKLLSDNYKVFLSINATLYMLPIILGVCNFTKKNRLIFFFIIVSMFFFKSMGINTTRQGIAFAFFLLALSYSGKRKWLSVFLFVLAFFNHASIIIPICMYTFSKHIKNIKLIFLIYIGATLLSIINFDFNGLLNKIPIVNILVEDRLNDYYNIEYKGEYKTGFRIDFYMFNTIFSLLGYYTYSHLKDIKIKTQYLSIYISYMLCSSIFFLMFSASFSDRFGFLSWLFIPLLLYPYTQTRLKIGKINLLGIYILCVCLFLIFNLA